MPSYTTRVIPVTILKLHNNHKSSTLLEQFAILLDLDVCLSRGGSVVGTDGLVGSIQVWLVLHLLLLLGLVPNKPPSVAQ